MQFAARNEFHFLYSIHKSLEPKSKDRVIDSNGTCWNRMDCFVSIVSERTANGRIYFGAGKHTYATSFTLRVDIGIRCFVQHRIRQPIFKIQVETLFRPAPNIRRLSKQCVVSRVFILWPNDKHFYIDSTNLFNLLHGCVTIEANLRAKEMPFKPMMVKNGESTCTTHLVFVNVQRPQIRIE